MAKRNPKGGGRFTPPRRSNRSTEEAAEAVPLSDELVIGPMAGGGAVMRFRNGATMKNCNLNLNVTFDEGVMPPASSYSDVGSVPAFKVEANAKLSGEVGSFSQESVPGTTHQQVMLVAEGSEAFMRVDSIKRSHMIKEDGTRGTRLQIEALNGDLGLGPARRSATTDNMVGDG